MLLLQAFFSFHAVYLNSTAFTIAADCEFIVDCFTGFIFAYFFVLDLKILFTNRALHDLSLLFGFLICIYSLIK
ncbi:hypothetical protein COPCOM_01683 [Coprococcus comes ATCC 27758]|uniref:Uncharacterized protein n=1 Tax=Coprococcus comes ATCC 27758 TaxID=470146 RepID=C0B959_9FIRM|nr:hypothetical protein COPCOM_01683 [Coprococcus comes ATCC 27758]